jgi:SAM-dependent methyltransferase
MKEWFAEWFDTSFYHQLYKSRSYEEAQQFIDILEKKLNFKHSDVFLDLACGKGRHSIYLNSKGYDVIGVDLSPNNIEAAKQSANEHLGFYVHDMRETFRSGSFDFVLNLFTSFGYFDENYDNFRAIKAVAENLKSGGTLVLDYMNSAKAVKNLTKYYEKEVDGIKFIITKKIEYGFIIKNIDFDYDCEHHHFEERVKILTCEDFRYYFRKVELTCKEIYGSYDLKPFEVAESDRMIFVVQKMPAIMN